MSSRGKMERFSFSSESGPRKENPECTITYNDDPVRPGMGEDGRDRKEELLKKMTGSLAEKEKHDPSISENEHRVF